MSPSCRSILPFIAAMIAMAVQITAAGARDGFKETSEEFFAVTNLYTFHVIIPADQWDIMETYDQMKASAVAGRGRGEGPRGFNGDGRGPQQNRPPMMMGIEFHKGTATLEFEGERVGQIGVRFKGNSSFNVARNSLKRSLKLDFNDVDKSLTFFGMTKLNLNNNAMDPVQIREALGYEIVRKSGVPAARTAFARVYISVPGKFQKTYAGLYTVVEQIDGNFLKKYFDSKKGMLLKPERVQGLPYMGEDWKAYEIRLQPKTEVKSKEAAKFIEFVRLVNQANDDSFNQNIPRYLNLDDYLRFVAVQAILSNMDSPMLTGHNYYIYFNPKSEKFVWIPWDLNEAFGGFMGGGSVQQQIDLSIDHPFTRANRLSERIFAMPGIKERYHQIIRGLLADSFSVARLSATIDAIAQTIRPALRDDRTVAINQFERNLKLRDFPANDFENRPPDRLEGGGFQGGGFPGGRVKPALGEFIVRRHASIEGQLEGKIEGYIPTQQARPPGGGRGPGGPPDGPRPFPRGRLE